MLNPDLYTIGEQCIMCTGRLPEPIYEYIEHGDVVQVMALGSIVRWLSMGWFRVSIRQLFESLVMVKL